MVDLEKFRIKKFNHELKRKAERKLMKKVGYNSDAWRTRKSDIEREVKIRELSQQQQSIKTKNKR